MKTGKKKDKDPGEPSSSGSGKVNVVAQELKFAKMLASNDVKIRIGVLKSLKKWLNTRSQSSYRKYILIACTFVTCSREYSQKSYIQATGKPALFRFLELSCKLSFVRLSN
jgi:Nucleolar protein,Nop52